MAIGHLDGSLCSSTPPIESKLLNPKIGWRNTKKDKKGPLPSPRIYPIASENDDVMNHQIVGDTEIPHFQDKPIWGWIMTYHDLYMEIIYELQVWGSPRFTGSPFAPWAPRPASRTSAWEDNSCHTGTAAEPGTKTCGATPKNLECNAVLSNSVHWICLRMLEMF